MIASHVLLYFYFLMWIFFQLCSWSKTWLFFLEGSIYLTNFPSNPFLNGFPFCIGCFTSCTLPRQYQSKCIYFSRLEKKSSSSVLYDGYVPLQLNIYQIFFPSLTMKYKRIFMFFCVCNLSSQISRQYM